MQPASLSRPGSLREGHHSTALQRLFTQSTHRSNLLRPGPYLELGIEICPSPHSVNSQLNDENLENVDRECRNVDHQEDLIWDKGLKVHEDHELVATKSWTHVLAISLMEELQPFFLTLKWRGSF